MPLDLTPHLIPRSCAVVNMECQEGLLGSSTVLPGLAAAAAEVGLIDNLAGLFDTARGAGVRIYYCTDERRADGFGFAYNPLMERMLPEGHNGGGGRGPVMAAISPRPEDVVFRREQGLTGFYATGLDAYLRNTGVTTIVLTGISLNLSVVGTAIEAANRGYTIVVLSDGVASDPAGYAETILRYTIRNIAFVVPTKTVVDIWNGYTKGDIEVP
jgi:nicotinamidase-related amidase